MGMADAVFGIIQKYGIVTSPSLKTLDLAVKSLSRNSKGFTLSEGAK